MTREEAIKVWLPVIAMGVENMPELKEALEMATKALGQEPCEDAVSRQNAIAQCSQAMELINGEFKCELPPEKKSYNAGLRKAIEIIRAMPPVKLTKTCIIHVRRGDYKPDRGRK